MDPRTGVLYHTRPNQSHCILRHCGVLETAAVIDGPKTGSVCQIIIRNSAQKYKRFSLPTT